MIVSASSQTTAIPQTVSAAATTGAKGTTQATTGSKMSAQDTLNKNQFLNLLIQQLKYQDPLNPMDNAQFTSQMAQFSQLEQLYNVNASLGSLSQINSSVSSSQAYGMIGKQVTATGNSIDLRNGSATTLNFSLPSDVAMATVQITNSSGQVVANLPEGALTSGNHSVQWNGRNDAGALQTSGTYTFSIDARTANGTVVTPTTFMTGIVQSVSILNGTPSLRIGNAMIAMSDIMEVSQP